MRSNHKYNAKPITIDGHRFPSHAEGNRYNELKLLQRAKVIENLQLQVPYILIPKSEHGQAIKYVADFVYYDTEKKKEIIEDVKGYETDVYKLKKRMMAELGHEIKEIK